MFHAARKACGVWLFLLVLFSVIGCFSGCKRRQARSPGTTTPGTTLPADEVQKPRHAVSEDVAQQPAEPEDGQPGPADRQPGPVVAWNELLEQTNSYLQQDALDDVRQNLARLEQAELELTAEQTEQLATARSELERRLQDDQVRAAVKMLASKDRDEVRTAQNQLFEKSGAALVVLRESVQDEDPLLVRNTLEMLRTLDRPEATLPIMVGVLGRAEQAENWPDAIREIESAAAAGAGEPLLELALSSDVPEQRVAALTALSGVVDPPRRSLVALLPLLYEDGPELAAALEAACHALRLHGQYDLLSGRGLDLALQPEQLQKLDDLPARLSQIIAAGGDAAPLGEVARAAKAMAITIRQIPAEPLRGIRILAFGAEMDNGRAAAVLDGQWNTVDASAMWRYPVKQPGSIIFDLGSQRTVAGVRIWNFNQSGGTHRGWKDVAICVGSTPAALLKPVATGMVAQAPGKAASPDYSTTVPVEFVRGRYVRLQANSVWREDSHAGLTEVQILGF